jgi:hypothetical protein
MSLDVYLNRKRYLSYDEGKTYTEDTEQVYWANITHNVRGLCVRAGLEIPNFNLSTNDK